MPTQQHILSGARRSTFDKPADLDTNRNRGYLTLDNETFSIIRNMSAINKVGFILQKANFHAKGRFYETKTFKTDQVNIVKNSLGIKQKIDIKDYAKSTKNDHEVKILKLFGWNRFKLEHEEAITIYAKELSEKFKIKEDILFKLVEWCWAAHVSIPKYSKLLSVVNDSYSDYENALFNKVDNLISEEKQKKLLKVFNDEILTDQFKSLTKTKLGISPEILKKNGKILASFERWHSDISSDIDKLDLTRDTIEYFSSLVCNSTLPQLKKLQDSPEKYLRALCFITDQLHLRIDFSIDAFIKEIRKIRKHSIDYDKEQVRVRRNKLNEEEALIIGSAENASHIFRLIINIGENKEVGPEERNEKIVHLARAYLEGGENGLENAIERIKDSREKNETHEDQFEFLFNKSRSLAGKYDQYLQLWKFDLESTNKHLPNVMLDFTHIKELDPEKLNVDFLSKVEKKHLFTNQGISFKEKYRIFLFLYIEKAIRNKSLVLLNSYRFRSPDASFIPKLKWKTDKKPILNVTGLAKHADAKKSLQQLGDAINRLFNELNTSIESEENQFVFSNPSGEWRHSQSRTDYSTDKFIPGLLAQSKSVSLIDIIREIDGFCDFSDSFKNYRAKGGKTFPEKELLYATLYSLGTNIGHNNVSKMTGGEISLKQLRDTELNFFSIKSLKRVNRILCEFVHTLNMPLIFVEDGSVLHTVNDGKKLVVNVDSLLANYSFKYYGKESGINRNNLMDPKQISVDVNILPSSDREAPYMLDALIENHSKLWDDYFDDSMPDTEDSDQEHIHSGDTHNYTEAIYSALWFKSIQLQPHIAKLWKKKLVAVNKKTVIQNASRLIRPSSTINQKLILENWDEMLRIMASIVLGHSSGQLVFRQLSAGAAHYPIYKSFQELGRLIRTKNTLRYLSDAELRADVRKYLNRVELGQKFGSAIFHGRDGKLQVGSETEILKAMLCKTILMNCIIAWNYLFLSDHYRNLKSNEDKIHTSEMIKTGSVLAYAHINMGGTINLKNKPTKSFSSTLRQMRNIKIL